VGGGILPLLLVDETSVSNANGLLVSDPVEQVVNVSVRFAAIFWEKGRYVQQERLLGGLIEYCS
jgi:hypothetical protein